MKVIILFLAIIWIASGCERQFSGDDPPMRPLVYTELPPSEETQNVESIEIMVNVAPEDLGYGIFHALIDHDRSAYEAMFISATALADLIHATSEDADRQTKDILKKSELMWTLFVPRLEAEEPIGGLSSRLRLSEFRLGKGRNLAGKLATPETDELVQHWGNELRIELMDSDKVFTIRIPKIVKTPQGWRIAAPIELDKTLQLFLETGMHLKSDLLTSEHYPMPLEVGNFWKYRIEKGELQVEPTSGEILKNNPVPQEATVNDMITDIIHREGYWIVSFERTLVDPEKDQEEPEVSHFSWLVTPGAIYPCKRDCKNNADSINYLLGYLLHQTPVYVFPLEVGQKWDMFGKKDNFYKYEVRALHRDPIVVPSGSFSQVYEIFGSVEEGRESRFFVPGIGVVMRTVRGSVGQKTEVLIKHRLIL